MRSVACLSEHWGRGGAVAIYIQGSETYEANLSGYIWEVHPSAILSTAHDLHTGAASQCDRLDSTRGDRRDLDVGGVEERSDLGGIERERTRL